MYLKFIGTDGSMGLEFGKIYKVKIRSIDEYIWVEWEDGHCSYSSPQTLACNWQSVSRFKRFVR